MINAFGNIANGTSSALNLGGSPMTDVIAAAVVRAMGGDARTYGEESTEREPRTTEDVLRDAGLLKGPYRIECQQNEKAEVRGASDASDDTSVVMTQNADQLQFLREINRIGELIPSDVPFYALQECEYEHGTQNALEQIEDFLHGREVLLDARCGNGLFEMAPDRRGSGQHIVYVGDISSKMASAIHKERLEAMMADFMRKMFESKEYYLSLPWNKSTEAERYANTVLLGHDRIALANIKTKAVLQWRIARKFPLKPMNNAKARKQSEQLEMLDDARDIWLHALECTGKENVLEAVGFRGKACALSPKQAEKILMQFAEQQGVDLMLQSLYGGVALDDIIA